MITASRYIPPMNRRESALLIAYRFPSDSGGHSHLYRLYPMNSAVSAPVTVMRGTPPILYLAIAEFSYSLFFRYGRIIAAIAVPRNVTAITRVASRINVLNTVVNA